MSAPLEIKRVTIGPAVWTAIVAPIACNNVTLEQEDTTNAAKLRTDSADANTEKALGAGDEAVIAPPDSKGLPGPRYRWNAGATVCFAQSVAGTGPIVAEFCQ